MSEVKGQQNGDWPADFLPAELRLVDVFRAVVLLERIKSEIPANRKQPLRKVGADVTRFFCLCVLVVPVTSP
jgi:hypothetical protein